MSEVKTDKISSVSTNGDITLDPDGTGKLKVVSGGASQVYAQFINSTGNGKFEIKQGGSSNALLQGFNASNSETVRLDPTSDCFFNGGNVGINTSSPNSNALLHVAGTASSGGSMGGKGIMLSYGSGNSAPIYFGTETNASAKAMYMESFYLVIRGHDNKASNLMVVVLAQ